MAFTSQKYFYPQNFQVGMKTNIVNTKKTPIFILIRLMVAEFFVTNKFLFFFPKLHPNKHIGMGQRETDVRTVGNILFKSQGQGRYIQRSPSLKMISKICLILFGLLVALAVLSAAESREEKSLSGDDDTGVPEIETHA